MDAQAEQILIPHPVHYYNDGNIVLVCQNVKFRLHQGILAAQSDVMKDMLAIPQPLSDSRQTDSQDQTQSTIDGVPAVWLMDALDALVILLDMILFKKAIWSHSLVEIMQVLDPVEKYCFDGLREFLKQYILSKYTRDLSSFEHLDSPSLNGPETARVITIARRLDIPDILPLSFYTLAMACSEAPVEHVVELLSPLSLRDQASLLVGIVHLGDQADECLDESIDDCFTGACFLSYHDNTCRGMHELTADERAQYRNYPLSFWMGSCGGVYENRESACHFCRERLKDALKKSAENVVGALASVFQI